MNKIKQLLWAFIVAGGLCFGILLWVEHKVGQFATAVGDMIPEMDDMHQAADDFNDWGDAKAEELGIAEEANAAAAVGADLVEAPFNAFADFIEFVGEGN